MKEFGDFQSNILSLPSLEQERYENIFKVYEIEKSSNNFYYFYNILKKIEMPDTLDRDIVGKLDINVKLPWTTLSYKLYGTQYLWWLLFLLNKPKNIFYAEAGSEIEYVKPDYITQVVDSIQTQIPK
jgi:hypothetical protein